jgi:hypothetical protein
MRISFIHLPSRPLIPARFALAVFLLVATLSLRADNTNLAEEVRLLREENALLQKQVQQQGKQLHTLTEKVASLEASQPILGGNDQPPPASRTGLGQLHFGLEGGVGLIDTGRDGSSPNNRFRLDDARLSIEGPLYEDIYAFAEVVLSYPEERDTKTELGEFYVEFENISKLWNKDDQLNARLGQMYIPFGEEYLSRNAIDNPLVSHSLTDFWGVTPGAELYGNFGKFTYVAAVQNGADESDGFGGDKSVAARIGFDPNAHWHFSVSGLRTGDLKPEQDSAMWFGTGFFNFLGGPGGTRFHVEAAQADISARWKSGHVSGYVGWARYGDNDPAANNARNLYFYSAEVVQNLPKKFFVAGRWSQIFCHQGIPIIGFGEASDYGVSLTTALWRMSLGLGYRFSDRLVLKTEYSFERGREAGGDKRENEDFFGTEAAFKF